MGSIGESTANGGGSHGQISLAQVASYGRTNSNEIHEVGVMENGKSNGISRLPSAIDPVAIVGMGMRLPGGIHSEQEFWDLLVSGQTTRGPIPTSRYNVEGFYTNTGRPASTGAQHGHYLSETDSIDKVDTSFFNFSKAEAEKLDPQQRMLLEVVWECMENAGQINWRGSNIGVFVGAWGHDWADMLDKDPQQVGGMLNVLGSGHYAIANRVSYEFDLHGPSFALNTACSSSMVSLHQAVQALHNGECDAAIVAGVNLVLTPTQTIMMTEGGILSPTGECRTFDASANGYSRGEAVNALLLKRSSTANDNRDSIRAVIRSTAVNCDGASAGFSTPSPQAQAALIRHAYKAANLSTPAETPYVEVHGTGTVTGDPIELEAVAEVFGKTTDTYVGGVKANVGHGESASGITSVIKSILALERKIIPPQANFSTPNPKISFEDARLVVPLVPISWPKDRPGRISVNSLGITGTNAHAIIESVDTQRGTDQEPHLESHRGKKSASLILMSATNSTSLKQRGEQVQTYLHHNLDRLTDVAYTLACRREHLSHRAYSVTNGDGSLELITSERVRVVPKLTFVFTGQGAQWATMGKSLIDEFPTFRDDIQYLNTILKHLPHPPSWNLVEELLKEGPKSRINKAEFSQPLCTAIQVALVNLLKMLEIEPATVVGHSSGEIGAAYAAGALTAQEAIAAAYYRGLASTTCSRQGVMAAVGISRAEATLHLEPGAVIACDNSPQSATISGDEDAIDRVIESIKSDDPDMFVRKLKTDGMAYHSHHMAEVGQIYERYLEGLICARPPKIAFFSTVTGTLLSSDAKLGPQYWRRNLESSVRFFPAVRSLIEAAGTDQLFLEIGPHSALSGPLRQIFKISSSKARLSYCPSLVRGRNAVHCILDMCGQLYLQTISLKLERLTPGAQLLTDLPNYPWRHDTSHWAETRAIREWRTRKFAPHELLGSRILEGSDVEPTWRNFLRLKDVLWLQEHKVYSDVVVPGAAYVAMAGEAAMQIEGITGYNIRDMSVKAALVLQEKPVELMTSLRQSKQHVGWFEFAIYSHNGSVWTEHTDGLVQADDQQLGLLEDFAEPETLPRQVKSVYDMFEALELHYGPHFQGLEALSVVPGRKTAAGRLTTPSTASFYPVHPATMDQCLQLMGIAASEGLKRNLRSIPMPRRLPQLEVRPLRIGTTPTARAVAKDVGTEGNIIGDIFVVAESETILSVKDCHLAAFEDKPDSVIHNSIAAARLSWRPHLDFVPLETLMVQFENDPNEGKLIGTYGLLCVAEIQHRIKNTIDSAKHLAKFRGWMDAHIDEGLRGENRVVRDSQMLLQYSPSQRNHKIEELRGSLQATMFRHVAELISRLLDNCEGIFDGSKEVLEIYTKDDSLTKLYSITGDRIDSTEFFVTAGHTNPNLRVLEIGTGTGGTSLVALRALTSAGKEPMYSSYTVTDISSGFFNAAKERLSEFPGLEFKTLDISNDPTEQGFDLGIYDLIIASNVLHATDFLRTTLTNVHRLLSPRGRLFLQELKPSPPKMLNIIMGPLPGWWLGEADARPIEPLVSPERWNQELQDAGFSGIECIVHDDINPNLSFGMNIIAKPALDPPPYPSVTLLVNPCQLDSQICTALKTKLESRDYLVDICALGDSVPPHQDIISLVELDEPFFGHLDQVGLQTMQKVLSEMTSARMLWVMGSAQMKPVDPLFATTLGTIRCIRQGMSIPIATFEIAAEHKDVSELVLKVFENFLSQASLATTEQEYCAKEGIVYVSRFHGTSVFDELAQSHEATDRPLKLELPSANGGAVARWKSQPKPDLGENDVLIRPVYIGTLGTTLSSSDLHASDYCGEIVATGTAADCLQVGDMITTVDVVGIQTSLVVPANRVMKVPSNMSLLDASTLTLAYTTSIYTLLHAAQLKRGQSILIADSSSALGQAAASIAEGFGAQVFGCVTSEAECVRVASISNLRHDQVISRSSLSNLEYDHTIRRVDIVFNNSDADSSDLAHCLTIGGKFLNITGLSAEKLDASLLKGNKTIHNIDMAGAIQVYPELLSQLGVIIAQGKATPLKMPDPVSITDVDHYLHDTVASKEIHLRIRVPEDLTTLPLHQTAPELKFVGSNAYLMIGGLGGLGKSVSTWLVEHGARHIVFISRSAASPSHHSFFHELEVQGCTTQALECDISSADQVRSALTQVTQPIAGVLHMGMVLSDQPFLCMSIEDWKAAIKPKVVGTMNVHHALLEQCVRPDFFVMFSSISGSFGMAHQANYAAGNTFQDAFVQYRHGLGLPASVLDIGAMSDIGYVSETPEAQAFFRNAGMPFMNENELFQCLHLSILQQHPIPSGLNEAEQSVRKAAFSGLGRGWAAYASDPGYTERSQLVLGLRATKPMTDPSNRVVWRRDRRADIYRNIEAARLAGTTQADESGGGSGGGRIDRLTALMGAFRASSDPAAFLSEQATLRTLTRAIGRFVYEFMLKTVRDDEDSDGEEDGGRNDEGEEMELQRSLMTLGVDSLVTIEVRSWLRRRLGVEVSTLEMLNGGTIEVLGALVAERLKLKLRPAA